MNSRKILLEDFASEFIYFFLQYLLIVYREHMLQPVMHDTLLLGNV